MEDDEGHEPYTAHDYWDEVYEDTMEYLKYLMESHREEASRVFKEKLEEIKQDLQSAVSYGGGKTLQALNSVDYEIV